MLVEQPEREADRSQPTAVAAITEVVRRDLTSLAQGLHPVSPPLLLVLV